MPADQIEHLLRQCRNIHCVGRNYADHAAELQNEVPSQPVIFSKSAVCLTQAQDLKFPKSLQPIHHELEVVLRIAHDLPLNSQPRLDDISHMGLGIDFTARSLQSQLKAKGLPWHLSKSFQDSAYVADLTAVCDGPLDFELHCENALIQRGDTQMMLFDFKTVLAYICRFLPLQAGDLIYTGTPAGVAAVKAGSTYTVSSEKLAISREWRVTFV